MSHYTQDFTWIISSNAQNTKECACTAYHLHKSLSWPKIHGLASTGRRRYDLEGIYWGLKFQRWNGFKADRVELLPVMQILGKEWKWKSTEVEEAKKKEAAFQMGSPKDSEITEDMGRLVLTNQLHFLNWPHDCPVLSLIHFNLDMVSV